MNNQQNPNYYDSSMTGNMPMPNGSSSNPQVPQDQNKQVRSNGAYPTSMMGSSNGKYFSCFICSLSFSAMLFFLSFFCR